MRASKSLQNWDVLVPLERACFEVTSQLSSAVGVGGFFESAYFKVIGKLRCAFDLLLLLSVYGCREGWTFS